MNVLLAPELPGESTGNGDGMSGQDGELSQYALRFVEDAELAQDCPTIVVDFFPGQTVFGVERIDAAERELDSSARRQKTSPAAEMRTANHDLHENGVICNMPSLYINFQIRERLHELLVKQADSVPALMVFAPSFIIVARRIAEGAENAFQVMLVLKSNVAFDKCDTSRLAVFRNRCAGHDHLQSRLGNPGWVRVGILPSVILLVA